jgi:hypothetical protein
MLRCRDVSTLISTDTLASAPWTRRLAVRLHLAMCRHCRRFARQIELLRRSARTMGREFDAEAPELDERIRRRLSGPPPSTNL